MNKIMKKFIIMMLVAIIALLGTACDCSGEEDENTDENRKSQIHNYSVEETNKYFIKNGKSDYVIVFPSQASSHLTDEAVSELTYFFKQATGITLASKPDTGLTFNNENKYISIGDTSLVDDAGITVDASELSTAGFVIKTVGDSYFIVGGDFGELYGVYALLKVYFDFEVYAGDEIKIKNGVFEQKFLSLDIKDVPDIEHQIHPYASPQITTGRYKFQTVGDVYAANRGYVWHNILHGIIPFELYGVDITKDTDVNGNPITQQMKDAILAHPMFETRPDWFNHPEWYVMEKTQDQDPLGDGTLIEPLQVNITVDDANSEKLLYEVLLYEMRLALEASNHREMTFTMQDNSFCSEDAVSMANYEKYGTHAAEYIQKANYIATELKKDYPDFKLTIFAYSGVKDAPVKLNSEGEYVPFDDSVVLAENVNVMLCLNFNRSYDITDEEVNGEALTMYKQWSVLLGDTGFASWLYNLTFYSNYFLPTSTLLGIANNYRFLYEQGCRLIFDEAQVTEQVATNWAFLQMYLISKMRWDVYQDMNTLINDFFVNYYKAAAQPMLDAFNLEQNRLAEIGGVLQDVTNIASNSEDAKKELVKESAWSDNLLQQILAKFDDAFKAIEIYKDTDPVLYQKLYNRINLETFPIRYLRIEIYGKYYGDLKNEWVKSLGKDAKSLGMKKFGGLVSFESYFGDV